MAPFFFLSQRHDLIRLITISLLLSTLLLSSIFPAFAEGTISEFSQTKPGTSQTLNHVDCLIQLFWENPEFRKHFPNGNALFDYTERQPTERKREIGSYLSALASFPDHIAREELHRYVYVALAPGKASEGIALVAIDRSGWMELVQIPLKPASKKLVPRFENIHWLEEVGDAMQNGKTPRKRYILHLAHKIPVDGAPNYQDKGESIFYSTADIAQFAVTATIQGRTYRAGTTNQRTQIAFELDLHPIRDLVGEEDTPSVPKEKNILHVSTRVDFSDQSHFSFADRFSFYSPNPIVEVQRPAKISISMPSEILETQMFPVQDRTSSNAKKHVYIDGVKLGEEECNQFLQGKYLFPLLGKDKVYSISIVFESGENHADKVTYSDNVLVYTAKPHVQLATTGLHKFNRILTASARWSLSEFAKRYVTVDSPTIQHNSPLPTTVTQSQPGQLKFYVRQEHAEKAKDTDSVPKEQSVTLSAHTRIVIDDKVVQRKLPKDYLEASSEPYEIQILQDIPPVIFALPALFSYPRNHAPEILIKTASLDGDKILETRYELRKQEKKGNRVIESGILPAPKPEEQSVGITKHVLPKLELGTYTFVITSTEQAVGDATPHIVPLKEQKTVELVIQNVAPVTQIRVKSKNHLPPYDVVVTTRNQQYSDIVSKHHIDISNRLREQGYDVLIRHRDFAIYTDQKYVEQSVDTGTQYPDATYHYSSSGYHGLLHRYNVSTATSLQEGGRYVTTEKSETIEERVPNRSGGVAVYKWRNGRWVMTQGWNGTDLPDTMTRSCPSGGSVVMRKVAAINNNPIRLDRKGRYENETIRFDYDWTAVYNGICTKKVKVWEPSTTTIHTYTGYYKGDVRAQIQKPYHETLRYPTTKLELEFSGPNPTMESLYELIESTLRKETFPANVFLVGEPLAYEIIDLDPEQDPTTVKTVLYEHDPSVFDNPGEQNNRKGKNLENELLVPGKYHLSRTIQDIPPDLKDQKESTSSIALFVHRKPVARFEAHVKSIDTVNGQRIATIDIADLSYDPDLEKRDDERGIAKKIFRYRLFDPTLDQVVEHSVRSKLNGDAQWTYGIPDKLPVGKYVISLVVLDKMGAWSDEYSKRIDATLVDAVEITALLRGLNGHSTASIPAGEQLLLYDVTTKYTGRHQLEYRFPSQSKPWAFEDADELGNHRYAWKNWTYTIPSDTPDGTYHVNVVGTPSGIVTLPYTVSTPIFIRGNVQQSDKLFLSAVTSPYATSAAVTVFAGTPYESKLAMQAAATEGTEKRWSVELDIAGLDMPSDAYRFDFIATTDAGKTATDMQQKRIAFLSIESVDIKGSWNKWNTHRFLGYEKISIEVRTRGKAESVAIRFSPELEAMSYKNSKGDVYRYVDEFGYTVTFPISLTKMRTEGTTEIWSASYILPIAPSSIDWKNRRIRPSYQLFVEAKSKSSRISHTEEIDVTGNVHDLMYIRPGFGD